MEMINKQLLLQDLCARLPFGVRCSFGVDDAVYEITGINPSACGASEIQATHIKSGINGDFRLSSCKPYLFPIPCMTEEQKKEYAHILVMNSNLAYSQLLGITVEDWFNKNHLDYRGLIPMGLAKDATGLNIY